jgi:Spy/CpxP family protein refolding chaperone
MKTLQTTALACVLLSAFTACTTELSSPHAQHQSMQSASPYAGQQTREIKALSPSQTQDILAGKGMELAKAAELNGYPGPMHVLEWADSLRLTPEQRQSTKQLMDEHKAEARSLGAQVVAAERELDTSFKSQNIKSEDIERLIGTLQAALRNSHLQTHLLQTNLLSPQQVAQYVVLRGYGTSSSSHSHH